MFDCVLKMIEKLIIAASPPHITMKWHSTEIQSKHWQYLLHTVRQSGRNEQINSLNESVLFWWEGREYETFLRVLNWQCLTSTADTRGEQSVLRHMRRTVKEAGGICRGNFSFCLAQTFWYNYKVQLQNSVDPIQSESKLSSSSGIVWSCWVRTWIKNVLYKVIILRGFFWWYIHYLPFFLSQCIPKCSNKKMF